MCCHFYENRCNFIFFNPVKFKYLPLTSHITSKAHVASLKNNDIFGILESRPMIWHIQVWHWNTLIFDPYKLLITLWGDSMPLISNCSMNTSVASVCSYVRTYQRVRNSKKMLLQYTRLSCSTFNSLFLNSTTCSLFHSKHYHRKALKYMYEMNVQWEYCVVRSYSKTN